MSFHKYTGDFFPGTGKLDDNGSGLGKHFCLNVPLRDGIDDEMYLTIFKTVIDDTVTSFRPTSIVLQCGADSLGCDRLGAFNLSIAAHGECVDFVRKFNVPLLVLGGGGYTIKNVGRCWTYETAVLVGATVPDELPTTVYDSFFRDSQWKLHPPLTGKVENQNSPASLQRITISIRNKLRYLQGAPSVAMQEIPPDLEGLLADEERTPEEKDEEGGNAMAGERRMDRSMSRNEYFDGDSDVDQDDTVITSSRGRDTTTARRLVRAGRRGRGRGRPRGSVAALSSRYDADEDTEDSTSTTPVRGTRGRGRGRGRGRPRGRGAKVTDRDRDKVNNGDNPNGDTSMADVSTELDLDVDI